MKEKQVLVTGSNGFVGRNLCACFAEHGIPYLAVVRDVQTGEQRTEDKTAIGEIDIHTDWSKVLTHTDAVIHLAAKVHQFGKQSRALNEFRRVNVEGTLNLARQAVEKGVRRFIYISTIKVHGEESANCPFRPADVLAPNDPYAISKLEAEKGLGDICDRSSMELVIVRPPLIYGKDAKGNFARLVDMVRKGYYLPLAKIQNKRSLIGIDNFCSLLEQCVYNPAAAGKVLLASDGEDVSTPELIRLIGEKCHKPAKLIPVPPWIVFFLFRIVGMGNQIKKLAGNLQVDSSDTRSLLNWKPPYTIEQGITRCFEEIQ